MFFIPALLTMLILRVGKTTALRRLIGEIIDFLSAGEAHLAHPSTGAMDLKQVIVRTLSAAPAFVAG